MHGLILLVCLLLGIWDPWHLSAQHQGIGNIRNYGSLVQMVVDILKIISAQTYQTNIKWTVDFWIRQPRNLVRLSSECLLLASITNSGMLSMLLISVSLLVELWMLFKRTSTTKFEVGRIFHACSLTPSQKRCRNIPMVHSIVRNGAGGNVAMEVRVLLSTGNLAELPRRMSSTLRVAQSQPRARWMGIWAL